MSRGLTKDGIKALDSALARHVARGDLPGLVALAARPVTVEDVLSFHLGFGTIMTPGPYPIQRAESELGLKTLGPPWPPPDLTPRQWMARLGRLPLLDQPGTRWRYNTSASVAGVLIERVAGAPIAEVLRERVFEPLGMADSGPGPGGLAAWPQTWLF